MHTHKFLITGGQKLQGQIKVSGSKNAALPIIAASLLTDEPVELTNVPNIEDIATMEHILHFLGVETGKTIRQTDWGKQIDQIIPVPLHPKKQRLRGYNQSEVLAYGIREATGIAVVTNNLVRTVASETQTKKSREARWENVKDIFSLLNPEKIEGKHIMLVDDVITTGSTIEACVHTLQRAPGVRISVVAAACAPA